MKGNEDLIRERFDALSGESWLPEDARPGDFELKLVLDAIAGAAPDVVLDCGCAKGRLLRNLPAEVWAVGMDLSGELVTAAKASGLSRLAQGSASSLPFASGSFDLVYCVETLEHVPDTQKAIGEMVRVLRPGGTLLVVDKNRYSIWPWFPYLPTFLYKFVSERRNKWMYPADFPFRERYFSRGELARRLRRAGLSGVRCSYVRSDRLSLYRWLPFLSLDLAAMGTK